jgi:hypothetical protein
MEQSLECAQLTYGNIYMTDMVSDCERWEDSIRCIGIFAYLYCNVIKLNILSIPNYWHPFLKPSEFLKWPDWAHHQWPEAVINS